MLLQVPSLALIYVSPKSPTIVRPYGRCHIVEEPLPAMNSGEKLILSTRISNDV